MTQSQPKQETNSSAKANSAQSLKKALNQCLYKDRFRFSKRIAGASKIKKEAARNAVFDEIALDIAQSMMVVQQRINQKVTIEYPELLPVSQKRGYPCTKRGRLGSPMTMPPT